MVNQPMNILDIYTKYKIPPQLQVHQLRVAAVAKTICDHLQLKPDDTQTIISTCLVHDMGNIIKFNLDKFPEFLEPEGRAYWQKVKDDFIQKYGSSEHQASLTIAKEIGLNNQVLTIINAFGFPQAVENSRSTDTNLKICVYSDFRVTPHSVASLQERLVESYERNKNNPKMIQSDPEKFKQASKAMQHIEDEIFNICKIKSEDVNDQSISSTMEGLKKWEV